jgi:hypothetical protein
MNLLLCGALLPLLAPAGPYDAAREKMVGPEYGQYEWPSPGMGNYLL